MPFIIVTVLLDMMGIGLIIPVLPKLVTTLYGGDLSSGSLVFGLFIASYAAMQFFFAPVLGNLSDAYGRRPVILSSLAGAGFDYLMMAFAPTWKWLFVGRVISGITGANISAANAYIADVSPPEERAKNFGVIGACFGVGFVLGPALGGMLSDYGGLRTPFIVAAALNLLNALYGLFVLPESHPKENRRRFNWRRINPLASLGVLKQYPVVLGLAATLMLERLAHDALPGTWALYTAYRFNWSARDIGWSLAVVGICFGLVQGTLTGPVVKRMGERRALVIGLMIGSAAFLLYGSATQGWMMYAIIIASSIGGIAGPSLQALISRNVSATEQGAVQGALGALQGLAAIFGPLLATGLFGYFTSPSAPVRLPGAAFIAAAILVAAGVAMAIRTIRLSLPVQQEADQVSTA